MPAARRVPSGEIVTNSTGALGRDRRELERLALEPVAEVEPPQVPALRADEDPAAVRADGHGIQRVATGPDGFLDSSRDVPDSGWSPSPPTDTRRLPSGLNARARTSPAWLGRSARSPGRIRPVELRQGPEDDASVAAAGGQELAVRAEGQALDGVHVADGLGVVVGRR